MNKIDVVALFVHVDDGLQSYEVQDLFARERYRSDFKLTVAEAVTLFLLFRGGGFRHAKAFHDYASRKPPAPSSPLTSP